MERQQGAPSARSRSTAARERRKHEMSQQLLATARQALDDGERFSDLTVDLLTTRGKVSRSNFYVYFVDKAELLELWLAELWEPVTATSDLWWEIGADSTREDLSEVLRAIMAAYRPNARILAGILDTIGQDGPMGEAAWEVMRVSTTRLARHIATGQSRHEINERLNPTDAAMWLNWMAERVFSLVLVDADDARFEQLVETYTEIVWSTLYAPARTPAANS